MSRDSNKLPDIDHGNPDGGFVKVPPRTTTTNTPSPGPYRNTPFERVTVHPDSDQPYRGQRPAKPDTNQ